MKKILITLICLLSVHLLSAQDTKNVPTIYINKNGVMCWSDTNREASFYGVNYTLPFAHAYRAMKYLDKNCKEAIDKDVYHFARLGFNAYRIHIWDVEVSDKDGNLIDNDHLNLLDYLIMKLRERNIRVLITTMTNFGNGYPERNQDTGGFSYSYDKCSIHKDANAIKAQEQYISQLVKHTNPYTKLSYANDPFIIGFEINNEPCHADTPKQTEEYINRMLKALKKAGNTKPVFYNVSHNIDHVQAYYNTSIEGTTYQWYPLGLVAGHTRKGNFLPNVDNFNIPFDNVKGFKNKAKAVYEFDPADITYSYIYPAMARTFRTAGFQWMTQFSYDPIDMAWSNSEYQTHYLNLAYTPNKALSMKIAAEVAYTMPMNKKYPAYPNDTIFDNFRVSYTQDLSELNTSDKFYYSNNTNSAPLNIATLGSISGFGNSAIVKYEGTGAYFIDKLEDGLWRLEVMPDAVQINDPYAKPSLSKKVVTIAWNSWDMQITLPDLASDFSINTINEGNNYTTVSKGTAFTIQPGVYLLKSKNHQQSTTWTAASKWKNITLGEYVAPKSDTNNFHVVHQPAMVSEDAHPLIVTANIVGPSLPDSVIIYTDKVSFWVEHNPYIKMTRLHGYTYQASIPANMLESGTFRYNIIVKANNDNTTFPGAIKGNPLDWDFYQNKYYETSIVAVNSPIELATITDKYSNIDTYVIPETSHVASKLVGNGLSDQKRVQYTFQVNNKDARFFWKKYVKDYLLDRTESLSQAKEICFHLKASDKIGKLKIGFETSEGYTYTHVFDINKNTDIYRIPLTGLSMDKTTFLPAPYPSFLQRYFKPKVFIPFDKKYIETLIISTIEDADDNSFIEVGNIWLE